MSGFYDDALKAVRELLALGEREGFGITFTPDAEGWTVGDVRSMGAGDLLTGFDFGGTARGALRPLLELFARYQDPRPERAGQA